jgi:hypothetical protein
MKNRSDRLFPLIANPTFPDRPEPEILQQEIIVICQRHMPDRVIHG